MSSDPLFIQFLAAVPILNYFADFYHEVIPQADKVTGKWMFMSTPDIPVSIVIAYLATVVVIGPFLMRFLRVPAVKELLIIYNSIVLLLNLWLGVSFTWHIWKGGYQLGCQKVGKYGKHERSIASLLWIFHCSKIVELIDTLFLVLKKKGNQLTFLHWYHHSTIVVATWIGVKFAPGGSSAVIAMVNSWIHVFMYFYYEMMVLRISSFRNYKKFVTIMQIVQFMATIVHCTTALKRDCGYPKWILQWLLLYMISFLVLFIHFYIQTYWRPKVNPNEVDVKNMKEVEIGKADDKKQFGFSDPVFSEDEEFPDSKQLKMKQELEKYSIKNGYGTRTNGFCFSGKKDEVLHNGVGASSLGNDQECSESLSDESASDSDSQYSATDEDATNSSDDSWKHSDSGNENDAIVGDKVCDEKSSEANTRSLVLNCERQDSSSLLH